MNSIESLKVTGQVTFSLYDKDGNLKSEQTVKNLVVTAGLGWIASRMTATPTTMGYMALGSSSTAVTAADTALGTQLGTRVTATGSTTGAQTTYSATFAAGNATGAVVEAGIFNASTSGTMLCRTVFAVVNKGTSDSLVVTWVITLAGS